MEMAVQSVAELVVAQARERKAVVVGLSKAGRSGTSQTESKDGE
jgi:hypothetical protein